MSDSSKKTSIKKLENKIKKLEKINAVLIKQIESPVKSKINSPFKIFQNNIIIEGELGVIKEKLGATLDTLKNRNYLLSKEKDKVKSINKRKNKFLMGVIHDLLQPINAARIFSENIIENSIDEKNKIQANKIIASLENIEKLITSIMDISKFDYGIVKNNLESVSLKKLFNSLDEEFKALVKDKPLNLKITDNDTYVWTDLNLIRRVLQNLISNAINYTDTGDIVVTSKVIKDKVEISIQDSGPGIPENKRQLIFNEFERNIIPKQKYSTGFGLGLSIVERILKQLKIPIVISSNKGAGAIFSILVEKSTVEQVKLIKKDSKTICNKNLITKKILLISKDKEVNNFLNNLSKSQHFGLEVINSITPFIAIEKTIKNNNLDLIIFDNDLLDTDKNINIFYSYFIKNNKNTIIISSKVSKEIKDFSVSASCYIITKPIKLAKLRSLIIYYLV